MTPRVWARTERRARARRRSQSRWSSARRSSSDRLGPRVPRAHHPPPSQGNWSLLQSVFLLQGFALVALAATLWFFPHAVELLTQKSAYPMVFKSLTSKSLVHILAA